MTTAPSPRPEPIPDPVLANGSASCAHVRGHITDSAFYGHRYSTTASHRIFCDRCRHQRWLDVEAALALSQAELGIIPKDAAEKIAEAARVELLDLESLRAEIRRTSHSLVAFLRVFQAAENIRACQGLATPTGQGARLSIIPAVAGG